ncbi:MAG TPA: hypothetical protein VFY40_10530 [Blastocatellia bacterium]|nr:hypothetical protein [Blastocatellia bacterium]
MRRKKQLLAATLCAFSMAINSVAVVAQDKDKKQEPKPGATQTLETTFTLPGPANQATFIQSEFSFVGAVVKGAPYSAEAVTETIQTLGDGNRIVQSSSSKIFRDSEGRTRREQALKLIGMWSVSGEAPTMIFINDPVSSVNYNLNSNAKTAFKMMAPPPPSFVMNDEVNEKVKELGVRATAVADASGYSGAGFGTAGSVKIVNAPTSASSSTVRLSVTRRDANGVVVAGAPGVPMKTVNGVFSWAGEGQVNTEQLGNQVIEGVLAEGQRVTVTIEAGKIGNERPIVTVNERWYSPELQTVVLSKNSDPRMGETTYKLINIDRSEPDPSLFQVPADYTVEEGPGFGFRPMSIPPAPPAIQRRRRPNEN